jgi:hypothetical protein
MHCMIYVSVLSSGLDLVGYLSSHNSSEMLLAKQQFVRSESSSLIVFFGYSAVYGPLNPGLGFLQTATVILSEP